MPMSVFREKMLSSYRGPHSKIAFGFFGLGLLRSVRVNHSVDSNPGNPKWGRSSKRTLIRVIEGIGHSEIIA